MQATTYDDPNEDHVVNYVPDEISVVVVATDVDDAEVSRFYEHVRSRLNRQILTLLKQSDGEPESPFERDFAPVVLRRRFLGDRAVLQPLHRPTGRSSKDDDAPPLTPSIRFMRRAGSASHHMFFQLGRGSRRLDPDHLFEGLQSVRELTLLLNRFVLSAPLEPFGSVRWSIRVVAPNWLTVAFQFACGSPAGLPVAVDANKGGAGPRVTGALAQALSEPPAGEVIVAVLDTCPTQAGVDVAATKFAANGLLGAVQREVRMNAPALLPTAAYGPHLAGCLPRLQWDMRSGPLHDHPHEFAMADHGLFVTGVIHQILEGCGRLHLIRVLNDFGIGDVFAISRALAALPRALLGSDEPRPGEPRLVVNLSLGIDLPIPARLLQRWLPQTSRNPELLRDRLPDVAAILDQLHGNLADVVASLTERGILTVAATGNDALRPDVVPGEPPPPRFPARYDDVLGVAATRRDLQTAADYSNRGELAAAAWPGDIASFGGYIIPSGAADQPGFTDPADGVLGIFSADRLPGGAANSSGWVRWAGTSFATPIVAAIAARLWATRPTLDAMDVIALVRSFAQHPHGGPDPDSPLEVPVLPVAMP
jgi:Subtilase family